MRNILDFVVHTWSLLQCENNPYLTGLRTTGHVSQFANPCLCSSFVFLDGGSKRSGEHLMLKHEPLIFKSETLES